MERRGSFPTMVMPVAIALLLGTLVLAAGSASGSTDAVTLGASADTYLRSGAPDTNEGSSTFLRVRRGPKTGTWFAFTSARRSTPQAHRVSGT